MGTRPSPLLAGKIKCGRGDGMEQALRGWLQHYTDHAIHFWRELGYRTLEQPLPAPEFEELPDTAREPLRHAWLLYDDSHLRLK